MTMNPGLELFKKDPRAYTWELLEQGYDAEHIINACLRSMSTDHVRLMLDNNEMSPRFFEDYDD